MDELSQPSPLSAEEKERLFSKCLVLIHPNGGWVTISCYDAGSKKLKKSAADMGRDLAELGGGSIKWMTIIQVETLKHYSQK
jgi:hypothetical protein